MSENADDLYGQAHVDRYRETGGEVGHEWRGATVLILTTTGNKSGEQRSTPLIYRERDGDHIIVASKGGTPEHPSWYANLEADPTAEIEVKDERIPVRARDAEGEEREQLWKLMNEQWPRLRRLPGQHRAGDPGRRPRVPIRLTGTVAAPGRWQAHAADYDPAMPTATAENLTSDAAREFVARAPHKLLIGGEHVDAADGRTLRDDRPGDR